MTVAIALVERPSDFRVGIAGLSGLRLMPGMGFEAAPPLRDLGRDEWPGTGGRAATGGRSKRLGGLIPGESYARVIRS